MALLWGTAPAPPGRGPKPGLTVDAVVEAAIELADAEGLEGLSMRKVADRLGRSVMSLYTYVPGKGELLDLMLDRAQGERPRTYDRAGGWRPAAELLARDMWSFFERHPWVLQISSARASLGPNEMDCYETALAVFDGIGLDGVEVVQAVGALDAYVRGCAKNVVDARAVERATGESDDEWWEVRAALLTELQDETWAEHHPVSVRLGDEQVFEQVHRQPGDETTYMERDALDAFEFGLARLLDGIEALVRDRR